MDPAAVKELRRLYAKRYGSRPPAKRRRVESVRENDTDSSHDEDAMGRTSEIDERADDNEDDNFDADFFAGFDNEEDTASASHESNEVQVISFNDKQVNDAEVAVEGYKAFMSSKVPKNISAFSKPPQSKKVDGEPDSDDGDDLRKDKELQKLLRESHLLHEQGSGSLETSGKTRLKAMESQRIANGASTPRQQKMPIGMRKGIEAAAAKRTAARDAYARDNGIVTARKTAPVVVKKSNRTLHELNLGRYKNGKLSITRREIDRINGPRGGTAKGKKKRGFRDFSNIG